MADPITRLFNVGSKLQNLSEDKEKAISGYGYYDWAKSAFECSVTLAIIPVWYTALFFKANGLTVSVFSQSMTADAVLSLVVAISTLSVAIISPPLGVIADRRLVKMRWLKILTIVGAGGTFLIAIAPFLGNAAWIWIMVMYLFANIGLNGAGVFYNALLPHLGKPDELDDISNRAFAYGYLGAGVLLVLHLVILLATDFAEWAIQFSLATSGIWWYGFALITFAWVPEPPVENEMEKLKFRDAARFAVGEVKQTLKDYKDFPQLFLYMLAYFLFIDGINTVTALGGVYGTTVLGIGFTGLIIALLVIQFVAAPSAIFFTRLAESRGTKNALMISISGWVALCFFALCFAPLELERHEDYDILYEWEEEDLAYSVYVSWSANDLAQKLDYEDDEFDEQAWAKEWSYILPIKVNDDDSNILEWSWGDSEDEPNKFKLAGLYFDFKDFNKAKSHVTDIFDKYDEIEDKFLKKEAAVTFLEPTKDDLYFFSGLIEYNLENYEMAIKHFTEANVINPLHGTALYNAAITMKKIGLTDEAAKLYQEAITINPFLRETTNNMLRYGNFN